MDRKKVSSTALCRLIAAAFALAMFCAAAQGAFVLSGGASASAAGAPAPEVAQAVPARQGDAVRKVAELSYKTAKPLLIRKLTITPPPALAAEKRAKKIEILTSEFETDEETYWLSSGIFTLDATAETVVCEFEPVEAQFIKVKILESWGPEVYPELGKVAIGLDTFKLIGSVMDFDGGAPVESAEIYIHGEKKAESNRNGDFIIEDCRYSTLEISVKARGYHDARESAPVFSGKKVSLAFRLKKHAYTIYGRVTDAATARPVALASVTIAQKGASPGNAAASRSFITDEFGYYYAGDVASGSYEISASAEDYFDLVKTVAVDASRSYIINFIMKSKVDLGPLEVARVLPPAGDPFTGEVRVVFNKSLNKGSLSPENFLVSIGDDATDAVEVARPPLDIEEVFFDPAAPDAKTVVLKVVSEEKIELTPVFDVSVSGVSDIYGVKIPENGVIVSNRKGASH